MNIHSIIAAPITLTKSNIKASYLPDTGLYRYKPIKTYKVMKANLLEKLAFSFLILTVVTLLGCIIAVNNYSGSICIYLLYSLSTSLIIFLAFIGIIITKK